jgi:dTDP-4-amino-4,6-dideoxygalactose transaminase
VQVPALGPPDTKGVVLSTVRPPGSTLAGKSRGKAARSPRHLPAAEGGTPVRSTFLPLTSPSIGPAEQREVARVLQSGWLTSGQMAARFEEMLQRRTGAAEVVALTSCSAALHLSLIVAGVGPGDEVITSPITWPATANVIEQVGATPVFADVDPDTFNMDTDRVAESINGRTRAIIPVHLGGQPSDLDGIHRLASQHGLIVIEDAAHAIGAEHRGRPIGSVSRFTGFSFYPTKNITTGEGGALALLDEADAPRVRTLANYGITRSTWNRESESAATSGWVEPGFKYAMADVNAAIGVHQLPRLDLFNQRRARLASLYREGLNGIPELILPSKLDGVLHNNHLFMVALRADRLGIDRDRFAQALRQENVGSGVHYRGLHLQPYYRERYRLGPRDLPVATFVSEHVLSLPLFPAMSDEDALTAVEAIGKLIDFYRR